jgi:hypothetical protein
MSRLRQLQIEWNNLVPDAQARGIRVNPVRLYPEGLHERITHRQNRLNQLRTQLGLTTALTSAVSANVDGALTFGVELEFTHRGRSRSAVVAALTAAGIVVAEEGYNHALRNYWKVTTDGSLMNYTSASEIVSPVLTGDDGFSQLTKVCEVLTSLGCKVDKKCGMHVHVGARNENVDFFKSLVRLYSKSESAVESFLAPSRRGYANPFCGPVRIDNARLDAATTVEQVATATSQNHSTNPRDSILRSANRYRKLNLQSFWQHGTVEFRQHHGTVDADKACNWVRFCLRMVLAARKGAVLTETTLEALLTLLETNETETRYFTGRKTFFDRATARATAARTATTL